MPNHPPSCENRQSGVWSLFDLFKSLLHPIASFISHAMVHTDDYIITNSDQAHFANLHCYSDAHNNMYKGSCKFNSCGSLVPVNIQSQRAIFVFQAGVTKLILCDLDFFGYDRLSLLQTLIG